MALTHVSATGAAWQLGSWAVGQLSTLTVEKTVVDHFSWNCNHCFSHLHSTVCQFQLMFFLQLFMSLIQLKNPTAMHLQFLSKPSPIWLKSFPSGFQLLQSFSKASPTF